MHFRSPCWAVVLLVGVVSVGAESPSTQADASPPALSIHAGAGNQAIHLSGPDSMQQLAVSLGEGKDGAVKDVTRAVKFETEPAGIVKVDENGWVTPLANGSAVVTAKHEASGVIAGLPVTVEAFGTRPTISFPNEIIPLFTRNSCNSGGCHGKAGGQNNFKLSLLGYQPQVDYEYIVKESRGRRVSPALPEHSLLLAKPAGAVPHQGGVRLKPGSPDHELVLRWIRQGLPYGPEKDPSVTRIEVFPRERVVQRGVSQQLVVTAFMSDGTTRDITHAAQYLPNQEEMASCDPAGRVTFKDQTGSTAVMVRFLEHVDVFMATLPLGAPVAEMPEPRNFVDQHVFARLETLGLPPSAECDDPTFIRRVTLDIAGRLPTLEETRAFLESDAPDKRSAKIDELLEEPGYAKYFAGKWASLLRNKSQRNLEQVALETHGFYSWLRRNLLENRPFDEWVTELITASGKARLNPPVSWYRVVQDPKEQMADIAQVFLGVRMHCAQCHHHPYEKWSQDDYYGLAAFFSTVDRKAVRKLPEDEIVYHKRVVARLENPATKEQLRPTPLDREPLEIPAARDPRIDLAKWVTGRDNPWFARMLANRYWKHFFGRGLVEPEDDMRVTNPPTHPALLDELASHFIASGYDLKSMIRVICNSRTYQLSAIPNEFNADDVQNYARYQPRRLMAEAMLDSINDVAGARNSFHFQPEGIRAVALPDDRANSESYFLAVFGRPQMDSACECERTDEANLGQSLHMLNSDSMQEILDARDGRAKQLASAKDRTDEERITELYLRALARAPTGSELEVARAHLAKKRNQSQDDPEKLPPDQAEVEAFEDIIWVLVNTKEFLFNH